MSAGTIKLTNGSTAVVGTSTTFTTDLKSGDVITTTIGGVFYTLFVDTVTSATAATITDAFTGPTTTGAAYVAVPAQTLSRVPAQLAILTQEAVRRVLQENVNWQSFYSGTGDITVTLPNGTPTGLPLTGPSWAKLSGIANTTWIDRGRIPDGSNINTFNPSTTEGTWHISGSATVTTANGFPVGAQRGVLTIVNGGYNSGTEIYVDQAANQWVRVLTAAWNGTDGPWSDWVKTGKGVLSDIGLGVTSLAWTSADSFDWQQADFIVGAVTNLQWQQFTNAPTLTGTTPAATTRCYVTVKSSYGTAAVVSLLVFRGNTACDEYNILVTGAKGSRTYTVNRMYMNGMTGAVSVADGGTGATTAAGARAGIGLDALGFGAALTPYANPFDWQSDVVNLVAGQMLRANTLTQLNPPTEFSSTTSYGISIFCVASVSTTRKLLKVIMDTVTGVGKEYYVYAVGAAGSVVYTVRELFSSASVVPVANGGTGNTTGVAANVSGTVAIANGGTGGTTQATARSGLGLKGASVLDVGTVAGTVAAGDDSRLATVGGKTGGSVTSTITLTGAGSEIYCHQSGAQVEGSNTKRQMVHGYINATQYSWMDSYLTSNNMTARIVVVNGSNTKTFNFLDSGNGVCDGTWVGGSDERFKYNIKSVGGALAAVLSWRGVTYVKKDGAAEVGLIAQDVEKDCPEAIINGGRREFSDGTVIEDFKMLNTAGAAAAYHTEAIKALFGLVKLAIDDPEAARAAIAAIESEGLVATQQDDSQQSDEMESNAPDTSTDEENQVDTQQ